MNITKTLTDADLEKADAQAVMEHFLDGKPIEPDVSARVQASAEKITERLRRTRGEIDVDQLIHDARDDS